MEKKKMSLTDRLVAPTSSFFKKIRKIGLCLVAIGGAIIAAPIAVPIALPAIVVTVAGYLTVAGGVMTAVAQATVEGD